MQNRDKILVVGEHCYDVQVYGECKRLCPEAPVPVFTPVRKECNPGMAGNVVENLKSIGPHFEIDFITNLEDSIIKTRYIDDASGQMLLRIDEKDQVPRITSEEMTQIKEKLETGAYGALMIICYNKGFLAVDDITQIVKWANQTNTFCSMDTKKELRTWSLNVDLVKINKKEFIQNQEEAYLWCQNLIVTKGKEGADLYHGKEFMKNIPATNISVIQSCGAGDTFHSAFIVRYLETKRWIQSIEFANNAAALAVSKMGVVAIKREEIDNII